MSGIRPYENSNGSIQVDLSSNMCLCVWPFMSMEQKWSAPIYNLTYGFVGHVLKGSFTNVVYEPVEDKAGRYQLFKTVVTVGQDPHLQSMGVLVNMREVSRMSYYPGLHYTLPAKTWHTYHRHEHTITILEKTEPPWAEDGSLSMIALPVGGEPDILFNKYSKSPEELWKVISEVLSKTR